MNPLRTSEALALARSDRTPEYVQGVFDAVDCRPIWAHRSTCHRDRRLRGRGWMAAFRILQAVPRLQLNFPGMESGERRTNRRKGKGV